MASSAGGRRVPFNKKNTSFLNNEAINEFIKLGSNQNIYDALDKETALNRKPLTEVVPSNNNGQAPASSNGAVSYNAPKREYTSYSDAASDIIKYKKWWDEADAKNDDVGRNNFANSAKPAYEWLRNNGYADEADKLQTLDYTNAKRWATNEGQATRPYLYSLGQKYGLSKEDVDKLITYDELTRNISIGGQNVGSADYVVDGVSYWKDTSVLDKAFEDYISKSGTTVDSGVDNPAYNQTMQKATNKNDTLAGYIDSDRKDVQGKYNDIFGYANQDITKTDEYKSTFNSIMGKYDLSALQGRDNAAASGAASNGGNIDSYSAANAMRQQAALTATGQQIAHQAGLDAYNARVSNVANILNNLGVYNSGTYDAMNQTIANDANIGQQYFDNAETAKNSEFSRSETAKNSEFSRGETAKNNEAARQELYSNISGTVGDKVTKWLNSNTWNEDGTLKNYDTDYQAVIDSLYEAYQNTTDENERARIWEQLRLNEMARNQKIDEQGLTYGKTYKYQGNPIAESGRQFDESIAYNKFAVETEKEMNKFNTEAEKEMNKYNTDATVDMHNSSLNANNSSNNSSSSKTTSSSSSSKKSSSSSSSGNESEASVDGLRFDAQLSDKHLEDRDVGYQGKQMYEALRKEATNKGGFLTNDEIVDFVVMNSSTYETNKAELTDLFEALGIPTSLLGNVENNAWAWFDGWKKGVKYKD